MLATEGDTTAEAPCCFVIAPIGQEGSDERKRSDQVLRHIIRPVAEEFGYLAIRADQIAEPGVITAQVIQHVAEDAIVIADLTGHNPNVFYELGVRHAAGKPVIQIARSGEALPFDVGAVRTIFFDHRNMDSVDDCRQALRAQISAIENGTAGESPISVAIALKGGLRPSDNPLGTLSAEMLEGLADVRRMLTVLVNRETSVVQEDEADVRHYMAEVARTQWVPSPPTPAPWVPPSAGD